MVAFFYVKFPSLTETFVLREILQLAQMGVRPELFSLTAPKGGVVHPEARELARRTHYAPFFLSLKVWSSVLKSLVTRPGPLLGLLGRLVVASLRDPVLLAKTLAIFPKSVHFGRVAKARGVEHIHSLFAAHNATSALIASTVSGIPYSISSDQYDLVVEPALHPLKFERARFLRVITRYNVELVRKLYGRHRLPPIHLIVRGVDLDKYAPSDKTMRGETRRGETMRGETTRGEPVRLLTVASLTHKKGHVYLLRALRLLLDQGRDFRLTIVGEGGQEANIRREIAALGLDERVTLTGGQTQEQVRGWLHASDMAVLPSIISTGGRMEGIPNALIEAMACALPVVSTTISGIPELVADGESGWLVPPEDPPALAEAIAKLMDDPDQARAFGQRGRAIVERGFRLETNVARLWDCLREAMGR